MPARCAGLALLLSLAWSLPVIFTPVAYAQNDGAARETVKLSPEEATAVAADRFALLELRVQAITMLGEHRTQQVAAVLIDLTSVGEPAEVRDAAFAALATLSCQPELGPNEQAWRAWWEEHRGLPAEVWYQRLLANFSRHNAELAARQKWAQDRLLEAHRLIYDALPAAEKPAKILVMLGDPLEAIRLLGMDFMHRRLIEGGEPPGEALLEAARKRLDDPAAAMRRRAALLLRDLADPAAADILARRLVVGTEKDPAALRAYLLLLTQVPRKEAVVAALDMLADARFRAEAAGMLASAAERALLDPRQAEQAARLCREHIRDGRLPDPQAIGLLGLIGNETDWVRIEQWLDSDSEAVKEAAALAWGRSNRPLLPLIQRAHDLVIRPNAFVAASRRGNDSATLIALIDSRLDNDPRQKEWQDAIVAMAGRVPPVSAIQAEQQLARLGQPVALRDRVVTAAIDTQAADPAQRSDALVDLLLLRAEIRLEADDFQGAIVDYKRIAELAAALNASQLARQDRGLLRARLGAGYVDGAVEVARRILENAGPVVDPDAIPFVVEAFEQAVHRHLAANATQRAQQTLVALRTLFGDGTPEVYRVRLTDLDARIKKALSEAPPSPGATPGATPTPGQPTTPPATTTSPSAPPPVTGVGT